MACRVPVPAAATFNADDDDSDYGPDFTAEEQDLLSALLDNITAGQSCGVAPAATATSVPEIGASVALGVIDIEDQEYVVTRLSESPGRSPLAQDDSSKKDFGYRVGKFLLCFLSALTGRLTDNSDIQAAR